MFELLPNEVKKSLKKEYFLRLSVVVLSFLFITGILFLVSISPSYFLSVVKKKVANKEFDRSIKSKDVSEAENLKTAIKDSKEMMSLLGTEDDKALIQNIILKIINDKNSGIRIKSISINYSQKKQYHIIVTGISKNREFLKSFADSLNEDFIEIDLPISNFAKIYDINFNISFKKDI